MNFVCLRLCVRAPLKSASLRLHRKTNSKAVRSWTEKEATFASFFAESSLRLPANLARNLQLNSQKRQQNANCALLGFYLEKNEHSSKKSARQSQILATRKSHANYLKVRQSANKVCTKPTNAVRATCLLLRALRCQLQVAATIGRQSNTFYFRFDNCFATQST